MATEKDPGPKLEIPDFDEFLNPERGELLIITNGQAFSVQEDGSIVSSNNEGDQEPLDSNRDN